MAVASRLVSLTTVGLLAATALAGGTLFSAPAAAQDAATLQAIQAQIAQLQAQLKQLQRQAAQRDAEVKRAQAEAAQARAEARQATAQAAAAPQAAVVAAQAAVASPAAPSGPPLPPGAFKVGGVTVTLGGFVAAEGIYRSRNQAASIDSNFNTGIPLANSPNYYQSEFRQTAQQSRLSLLVEAQPDPADKLTSYVETDFLSAGSSSNSNQSNSYTLRLRQFFGQWDNSDYGVHAIGGQGWSLATLYKPGGGLLPRQENAPLTIDAQYAVGFNWQRQPELRVVKDFADKKVNVAFALESPQTTFGGAAGPNCLTGAAATTASPGGTLNYTACGGPNVNSIQAYSNNSVPDIIAKVAVDPGYGHYELYGLLRFLGGRVSSAATGTGKNYMTTGQGIGGGMILPIIPKKLDFQVSGLVGQGVGRYGTSQLPDATFSPSGKIEAIPAYSVMGGFVAHPTPKIDVYAYGGAEGAWNKYYNQGTVSSGYGNPNANLSGCLIELGTCNANTSGLVEGTVGAWYRFLKGSYGTVQAGAQYEYIHRNTLAGLGPTRGSSVSPSSDLNAFLFSFRYLPFN